MIMLSLDWLWLDDNLIQKTKHTYLKEHKTPNPKGVFGCEKKVRREKEVRKSERRKRWEIENIYGIVCY